MADVHRRLEVLLFFRVNHALSAPLRVLPDADFLKNLHENHKDIKAALSELFGLEVVLITTRCLNKEARGLIGTAGVLHGAKLNNCLHKDQSVGATACLSLLLGTENPFQLVVATVNDSAIYTKIPGTLVVVADKNGNLRMLPPSEAQVAFAEEHNLGHVHGQEVYFRDRKILKLRARKKKYDLKSAAIRTRLRMLRN